MSFAIMNILIKYLIDYSTFQLVFFRSLGSLIITFLILKTKNVYLWGNQKKLLIFRALSGVIAMCFFYWGAHYISIGSAVTIRYVSPIFAAILATFFLSEIIKPFQWLFFLISFIGVFLIRNFDPSGSNMGIIIVLVASFFSAVVYILISKIGKGDNSYVIVFYFMLFATCIGGVGSFFSWKTPSISDYILLISLGIFGFFGQLFMTKAFQNEEVHLIAPFKYIEIVFTLIIGFTIIDEKYSVLHLLGAFLVIFGLLLNIFYREKNLKKTKKLF